MKSSGSSQFFNTATPPLPSEIDMERKMLNEYLTKYPQFGTRLQDFNTHLKRIDYPSTLTAARETLDLVIDFIRRPPSWEDPVQLLLSLRGLGRRVILARPLDLVVGCMVRRVLFLLREEMTKVARQTREQALQDRRKVQKKPSSEAAASSSTTLSNSAKSRLQKASTDDFEDSESSQEDQRGDDDDLDEGNSEEREEEDERPAPRSAGSKKAEKQSQTGDVYESTGGAMPSLQNILAESEAIDTSYFSLVATSPVHFAQEVASTSALTQATKGGKSPWRNLKKNIMQHVMELKQELDNVHDPIAKQSVEYIHAREVVLVYGLSHAVQAFLINAHKHGILNFEIFVAETSDGYRGHKMAMELANQGIDTTVITDSAIYALMARVNKVLIGARAIMANGGILSESGTNMVATAAKHHSVPLVCVTGLYKLCPLYPFNQDSFNDLVSPGSILPFADVPVGHVEVISPAFDYISPDKVGLIITDSGAHQPSYIYRLLAEFYSPLDKLTEGVPQLDL
jgi:translation initiation factor 2B subunit (eIF-2B alpha/beta/delta family)